MITRPCQSYGDVYRLVRARNGVRVTVLNETGLALLVIARGLRGITTSTKHDFSLNPLTVIP